MTRKTTYVVIWWMEKNPYLATFSNRVAAEAAANVRNAVMLGIRDSDVVEAFDWWRRDEAGNPMPCERRDLVGGIGPWRGVSAGRAPE